jgi:hypothetical protein
MTGSASHQLNETIGFLKWEIFDARRKNLVSHGAKQLVGADVESTDSNGLACKIIKLSDNFSLSLCEKNDQHCESPSDSTDRDLVQGFGLVARQDDMASFSFDWFEFDRPGHAIKLPELFELSVETVETNNGAAIGRMDFLTDVHFGVCGMEEHPVVGPLWRVVVLEGSSINWP